MTPEHVVTVGRQALDKLPEGPIMAKVPKIIKPPVGEAYVSIEAPKGELGYYIVSAGENLPWRVRTRPCVFINYSIFPKLIEGHTISDVVAVLGSINVIAAELDR